MKTKTEQTTVMISLITTVFTNVLLIIDSIKTAVLILTLGYVGRYWDIIPY